MATPVPPSAEEGSGELSQSYDIGSILLRLETKLDTLTAVTSAQGVRLEALEQAKDEFSTINTFTVKVPKIHAVVPVIVTENLTEMLLLKDGSLPIVDVEYITEPYIQSQAAKAVDQLTVFEVLPGNQGYKLREDRPPTGSDEPVLHFVIFIDKQTIFTKDSSKSLIRWEQIADLRSEQLLEPQIIRFLNYPMIDAQLQAALNLITQRDVKIKEEVPDTIPVHNISRTDKPWLIGSYNVDERGFPMTPDHYSPPRENLSQDDYLDPEEDSWRAPETPAAKVEIVPPNKKNGSWSHSDEYVSYLGKGEPVESTTVAHAYQLALILGFTGFGFALNAFNLQKRQKWDTGSFITREVALALLNDRSSKAILVKGQMESTFRWQEVSLEQLAEALSQRMAQTQPRDFEDNITRALSNSALLRELIPTVPISALLTSTLLNKTLMDWKVFINFLQSLEMLLRRGPLKRLKNGSAVTLVFSRSHATPGTVPTDDSTDGNIRLLIRLFFVHSDSLAKELIQEAEKEFKQPTRAGGRNFQPPVWAIGAFVENFIKTRFLTSVESTEGQKARYSLQKTPLQALREGMRADATSRRRKVHVEGVDTVLNLFDAPEEVSQLTDSELSEYLGSNPDFFAALQSRDLSAPKRRMTYVCYDAYRRGRCSKGSECTYSHDEKSYVAHAAHQLRQLLQSEPAQQDVKSIVDKATKDTGAANDATEEQRYTRGLSNFRAQLSGASRPAAHNSAPQARAQSPSDSRPRSGSQGDSRSSTPPRAGPSSAPPSKVPGGATSSN